jgi:outer membrane receptor protein involved in Fe transport
MRTLTNVADGATNQPANKWLWASACPLAFLAVATLLVPETRADQALPSPAAAAPAAASAGGQLAEVVVTARKRTENEQTAPVSVSVLSGAQLRRYDLDSLEKVAAITPGLSIARAATGSGALLSIRGISSAFSSVGIAQSVAVIVDGVYYGSGRTLNEGLFDSGQLEILKGPQALFFGKNATAGVISVTTADPTKQFDAHARVSEEFGSHKLEGEGVVSIPLTDTLGLRVAVQASDMLGGLLRNRAGVDVYPTYDVATGATTEHLAQPGSLDTPQEKQDLGRVTLKWDPTDAVDAVLKAGGDADRAYGGGWNAVPLCAGPTMQLSPGTPCSRSFSVYQDNMPLDIAESGIPDAGNGSLYNQYSSYYVTGTVGYDLPYVKLTTVNNYNHYRNTLLQDYSYESPIVGAGGGGWATEQDDWQSMSTEERALTKFDGPVNAMVGLYADKTDFQFHQWPVFAGVEDSAATPAYDRYTAVDKYSYSHGKTVSVYGQLMWKIIPTLELDGGARYIHETLDSLYIQPYANPLLNPSIYIQGAPVAADQVFDHTNPEVTLAWTPTHQVMVYGAYKTGFKSGGFSNSSTLGEHTLPGGLAFRPETAEGFEGGIKTVMMDDHLRLNLTGYRYRFTDLQIDFWNSITYSYVTTNAGEARTQGAELEADWAPPMVSGLTLQGSLNYNDARYVNFLGPCYAGQTAPEGCSVAGPGGAPFQDLSGRPTADAPLWTAALGGNYDVRLGGSMLLNLSANGRYLTRSNASSVAAPLAEQAGYFTMDAAIRLRTDDGHWELALIGDNVTNTFYYNAVYEISGTGSGTGSPQARGVYADQAAYVGMPRTIELQLAWNY